MNKGLFRRYGWAIYLLIGALAVLLLVLGAFVYKTGTANTILLSVGTNLLVVAVVFFLVQQFFQYDPEGEQQRHVAENLKLVSQLLDKYSGKMPDVQLFPNRTSIYDSLVSTVEGEPWARVRIFAPVGLWEKDAEKERWFTALAKGVQEHRIAEIWAVFGLPPKSLQGENRPEADVKEDLAYSRKMLAHFDGLKNVQIRFYPPSEASTGIGSVILEREQANGEVAFGLVSRGFEEVITTGFGIRDPNFYFMVKEWFDQKIFNHAVARFVLQGDRKTLGERWNTVIQAWYGSNYQ